MDAVITVKVTGTKVGYTTVTKESDPTRRSPSATLATTPTPTISGTATFGQTLSAVPGSLGRGHDAHATSGWSTGVPVPGATARELRDPGRRRGQVRRRSR